MENKEQYFIIRGDRSGVFAGNIKERNGREVTLTNCRRIWYWSGANCLSDMAVYGVKRPEDCKFSVTVPEMTVLDAIELIPCSEEAESCIKAVPVWKM